MLAAVLLNGSVFTDGEDVEALVAIQLSTTDLSGNPISSVAAGQRFLLQANVEDLRLDASGVFATYFDIVFDSNAANILGPLIHAAGFQNVVSGNIEHPGLIDDVGGTSTTLSPTGVGVAELFSVLVTANNVGELVFDTGPADILPAHQVLLYGVNTEIPIDSVDFGRVVIEVTPGNGDAYVVANDDTYVVLAGNGEQQLEVLVNDEGFGNLTVSAVDATGLLGSVSIAPNGQGLRYSPAANFSGIEQFSYTATDGNGASDDATVIVTVDASNSGDYIVSIRLAATDLSGAPIASIAEGNDFLLSAYVLDTRADPLGVFAAYADVFYSSSMIEPAGEIEFGLQFENGSSGDLETPGVVDEVGGFRQSLTPVLGGESRLFTMRFSALSSGQAVFQSDPADDVPLHDVLVYGRDDAVSIERIDYGSLTLDILSDVIAVDDSFHIAENSPVDLNVLSNDIHTLGDRLRIRAVDDSSLRGTVSVSSNGRTLTYTPEFGFGGTEQFTYVVEGRRGLDTAEVTVHTEPGAASDDVVAFVLSTTDLAGNPIDSIEAGQQFWLNVSVDDLRDADGDDLGVFAAYFDLLYDADHVSVVASGDHHLGFDVVFSNEYENGQQGRATVPGVIDEIGAFQSVFDPLGGDPLTLFAVRMQADTALGGADVFIVQEDAQLVSLDVLANDLATHATTVFRSDPADLPAVSDVLMFEPPVAIEDARIRFGETSLRIVSSGAPTITSVGPASQGGSVAISADGQHLEYTPLADFFGIETFTYTIDQGAPIEVEVAVAGVADTPQSYDDNYRVRANRLLSLDTLQGPLANDTDADGDSLEVTVVAGPEHGTLTMLGDGSLLYVPNQNFTGLDRFTYRAYDGGLVSSIATVNIVVEPPPVQIRLEVVDSVGTPRSHLIAGETMYLTALVQDLRDESHPFHGVGAAYLDIAFDPQRMAPVPAEDERFEIAIDFGDAYQNGMSLVPTEPGLLKNVGAFQTGFTPLGEDEIELFTIEMQATELQVVDDDVTVSMNSRVNSLDVMANEMGLTWDVEFDAGPTDSDPLTDVVFYDPPIALAGEDVNYLGTTVTVDNGTELVILSVGSAQNGGTVVITGGGTRITYTPPRDFVGVDSFVYTVVNEYGMIGTGTVTIDVVESWQNLFDNFDVNSDGVKSALDVLALINDINHNGARRLSLPYLGPYFLNVNGDGFFSPQDILALLNCLNNEYSGPGSSSEGEAPPFQSNELVVAPRGDELLPWGSHELLGGGQIETGVSLSNSSWQQEQIEPLRRAATLDVATVERRWQLFAERFERHDDDRQTEDDLIDGLDQLAADVAQAWAIQS